MAGYGTLLMVMLVALNTISAQPGVEGKDDNGFASPELKAKIKEVNALAIPTAENAAFRHYDLAVMYNAKNDEENTSRHMLAIPPYILMFRGLSPSGMDAFLQKFRLKNEVKDTIKKRFAAAYNAPHPAEYDSFSKYYFNIISLKHVLDSVPGPYRADVEQQLHIADSVQSIFLREYVLKNGWPAPEAGALYAAYLAGRDIEHYYDYLPPMLDAFSKQWIPLSMLQKIQQNKSAYSTFMEMNLLKRNGYACFDVTGFMDVPGIGVLSSRKVMNDIWAAYAANCPIAQFIIMRYTNDPKKYSYEVEHNKLKNCGDNCDDKLWPMFEKACPEYWKNEDRTRIRFEHLPNYNYAKDREELILVYGEKE